MAKPTEEQRRASDRKIGIVLTRIHKAGAPKRAATHSIPRKESHTKPDKSSKPIKRESEVKSDSEEPET